MSTRKKDIGLGDYFLEHRRTKSTFLDEINKLIDWQPINTFLRKKIRRKPTPWGIRRTRLGPCSRFYFFNAGPTK